MTKLNQANKQNYYNHKHKAQQQKLTKELAEANAKVRAMFVQNCSLSETNVKLQNYFKLREAEYKKSESKWFTVDLVVQYLAKYQDFTTKMTLMSSKYKKLQKKLKQVSELLRTQVMLKANNESQRVEDRLLAMFKGDEKEMTNFVLNMAERLKARTESNNCMLLQQKSLRHTNY